MNKRIKKKRYVTPMIKPFKKISFKKIKFLEDETVFMTLKLSDEIEITSRVRMYGKSNFYYNRIETIIHDDTTNQLIEFFPTRLCGYRRIGKKYPLYVQFYDSYKRVRIINGNTLIEYIYYSESERPDIYILEKPYNFKIPKYSIPLMLGIIQVNKSSCTDYNSFKEFLMKYIVDGKGE